MGSRRARGTAGGGIELLTNPALAHLHPTGDHPERPERIELLAGHATTIERFATREQLERVHDPAYLDALEHITSPVLLDPDTIASATSWEAATLATGIALEAVDRDGFALVRPPGHHALADRAMGFCLVNIAAATARYAQAELGLARVAIVDFDVHHGNGTEAIFRGDDTVLYCSLHQWPFYPGTGGPGTSDETTVNVPLPAGTGDDEYLAAFEMAVEPVVRAFEPDLVLVSAGFDAHLEDPLALLELTADGFREVAGRCARLGPRVAAVLEGGYNLRTLLGLVRAAAEGFGERAKYLRRP
jgi:acetoin utilization deacetylase AcuC-like enzyme